MIPNDVQEGSNVNHDFSLLTVGWVSYYALADNISLDDVMMDILYWNRYRLHSNTLTQVCMCLCVCERERPGKRWEGGFRLTYFDRRKCCAVILIQRDYKYNLCTGRQHEPSRPTGKDTSLNLSEESELNCSSLNYLCMRDWVLFFFFFPNQVNVDILLAYSPLKKTLVNRRYEVYRCPCRYDAEPVCLPGGHGQTCAKRRQGSATANQPSAAEPGYVRCSARGVATCECLHLWTLLYFVWFLFIYRNTVTEVVANSCTTLG